MHAQDLQGLAAALGFVGTQPREAAFRRGLEQELQALQIFLMPVVPELPAVADVVAEDSYPPGSASL